MNKEYKDTIVLVWFVSGASLTLATLVKQEFWFPIWFSGISLYAIYHGISILIKGIKGNKSKKNEKANNKNKR